MNNKVVHELLNSYGRLEIVHETLCKAIRPKALEPQTFADVYGALNDYKNALDVFVAAYFGESQPASSRTLARRRRSEEPMLPDNVIYFKDRAKALQR